MDISKFNIRSSALETLYSWRRAIITLLAELGVVQSLAHTQNTDTETSNASFTIGTKSKITDDGGFAIRLINKTGGASVKGEVVQVYDASAINNAVTKAVINEPDAIGVFLDSGVADGAEAWIVVSGIADVYFIGNTTRGHLARVFIASEAGVYVTGQAISEAFPTSPFATDKHFCEIGHVLESRTGAGLAKCVLHFN